MATIGAITILMNVDNSALNVGLEKSAKALGNFGSLAGTATAAISAFGLAQATTASGLVAWGVHSIETFSAVAHAASRIGTTTDALLGLRLAAKLVGDDTEVLDTTLQKMEVTLGNAGQKGDAGGKALRNMGLNAKELQRLDAATAFSKIAGAVAGMSTQAEKAATARTLFGRGGTAILNTLNLGAEGLAKMTADAKRLGAGINSIEAGQILKANEAIEKMQFAVVALGTRIGAAIAPAVLAVAETMAKWMEEGKQAGSGLANALLLIESAAKLAGAALEQVQNEFSDLNALFNLAVKSLGGGGAEAENRRGGELDARLAARAGKNAPYLKPRGPSKEKEAAWYFDIKEKADAMQKSLEASNAMFGLGAEATELYKLKMRGLPDSMAAVIEKQIELHERLEETKKAEEEMIAEAGRVTTETQTPLEKYAVEFEKLSDLYEKGAITRETFIRATNKNLFDDAMKLVDEIKTPLEQYQEKQAEIAKMVELGFITREEAVKARYEALSRSGLAPQVEKLPPAAEQGSKEAYSAIVKSQGISAKEDVMQKLSADAKKQTDLQTQMVKEQTEATGFLRAMQLSAAVIFAIS